MNIFKWQEIEASKSLKLYGAALALGHAVGLLYILVGAEPFNYFTDPVCWPPLGDCRIWREAVASLYRPFLTLAISLAVATAGLFILSVYAKIHVRVALWALLVCLLLQFVAISFDYRLKHNQHIMHFTLELAYLFIPGRQAAIFVLLPLFYFFAGLLKFNQDWLSASVFWARPFFVSWALLPLAAKYVILLETVFIWGLFSRRNWVRAAVLAQLLVFHFVSLPIVNFYYPILMVLLLSIYGFAWREKVDFKLSWGGRILIALFCLFQLLPKFLTSDSTITAQGRIFSLYMFDARAVCEVEVVRGGPSGEIRESLPKVAAPRLLCEPIVFWNQVRNYCTQVDSGERASVSRATLRSRRSTEKDLVTIADLPTPCLALPSVSMIYNSWIIDP